MILKKLSLENFRSFKKKQFQFSKQTTILLGPNRAGKTNVLEAIWLLATGKSFRAGKNEEMINEEANLSRVKGLIGQPDKQLEVLLTRGEVQGKTAPKMLYRLDGVEKKWRQFAGTLNCVLFSPQDIDLILGSPAVRRNYLDSVLEQLGWQYRSASLTYQKGVKRRNKVLESIRKGKAKQSQLLFWDKLLVKNGQLISQQREELVSFYNNLLERQADGQIKIDYFVNHRFQLDYQSSGLSRQRLEKFRQKEIGRGMTLIGPHRDEFRFKRLAVEGKERRSKPARDLAVYGSRGEQRLAVLALKLAELEFMTEKSQQRPVLLLDDIFSELDEGNKEDVLKLVDRAQVIITTAETEPIKDIGDNEVKRLEK